MATDQKLSTTELLFRCARQMGLKPLWVVPDDTFAIRLNGHERFMNLARSPLNSEASAALAKNKYITRRILQRYNMQNIPFTQPGTQAEASVFLDQYGTIIAKPITGAGAQDIHVITNQAELRALKIDEYVLEKYIAGKELRYLLLDGKVIGVYRSEYGTSVAEDRPLQCISYPEDLWDRTLVDSSLRIAEILNLRFAAVDYMVSASGRAYVLEVNTIPDLKWFHAPSRGPVVDVARLFLESIIDGSRLPARDILVSEPIRA